MTTNAENLAKAWTIGLDPSILVRIPREQWFSKCFLPLKLVLSRPPLVVIENGCCSPFYVQGFVLQQVKTAYFRCNEKGFLLLRVSSNCSYLHLILRFTVVASFSLAAARMVFATTRLNFTAVKTPYIASSVCIHFGAFQLIQCIFITFVTYKKNT